MKIAFFAANILEYYGGTEKYYITAANGLAKLGHKVEIITINDKFMENFNKLLFFYYFKKKESLYRKTFSEINLMLQEGVCYYKFSGLADLRARLGQFDVIYNKNEHMELILFKLLGYNTIPSVCLGLHTPLEYPEPKSLKIKFRDFLYTGFIYKYLIAGIKAFKVSNEEDLKIVKKYFSPKFLVKKVRHPINYGKREVVLNKDKHIRLVFIGRLAEEKGVNILIEILDNLKDKEIPYSIRIAGTGHQDYINRLKSMQVRSSSDYNLEYIGQLDSKELDELYKWTDLVIIPSFFETLSQVAIEACLNGKIPICSNVSGPREILSNCGEEFLLPLDVSKFAGKIISLQKLKKENPSSLKETGLSLQKEVARRFSSSSNLNELEKLLIEVSER